MAGSSAKSAISSAASKNGRRSMNWPLSAPSRMMPALCGRSWAIVACAISRLRPLTCSPTRSSSFSRPCSRSFMTPAAVKLLGGDAEAMARRHFLAAAEVGEAERLFENDAAFVGDGDHAAGLIAEPHLQCDPAWNVIQRRLEPFVHVGSPYGRDGFHFAAPAALRIETADSPSFAYLATRWRLASEGMTFSVNSTAVAITPICFALKLGQKQIALGAAPVQGLSSACNRNQMGGRYDICQSARSFDRADAWRRRPYRRPGSFGGGGSAE